MADPKAPYTFIPLPEFLQLELEDRKNLLEPWLREQGLAMVHAWRGVGKTFFGLSVAYAVASGTAFGKWKAPAPRRVAYLDGEMSAREMQERLTELQAMSGVEPPEDFLIFTPDLQTSGILNLSSRFDHKKMEPHIESVDLIVVDNVSTLVRGGDENEALAWETAQEWALDQRKRGRSVLFVHHDSKGGGQRGSSKREDVLDTVIHLTQPEGYKSHFGARFEVHFTKARGLHGLDVEPFEMALERVGDRLAWVCRPTGATAEAIKELASEGLTVTAAAKELGVTRSTAYRRLQDAEREERARRNRERTGK